ncbi:MAG: type IX secretion system membrane protein PorP/SprF, partial [Bacteroidetes bacterium]|nr:type IX secretion system membrane protein PorP/SprF [Fibrella sp.]
LYRAQWIGIEGAPQTATFTADMPVNGERVGVGLQLSNDKVGLINQTGAYLTYAFRLKLGERSTLAMGLQGGAMSYRVNYAEAMLAPGGVGPVDPAFAQNVSKILPNFGTGLYLSNDRGYLGLSVPYLLKSKLSDFEGANGNNRSLLRRHAYATAGLVVGLSPTIKIKPSFLAKYAEGAPLGFDGNVNIWFNDRIAIGTSFRKNQFYSWTNDSNDAIVGLIELQVSDQLRLGYAYDRTLNNLRAYGPDSHEFMLRYEFGFGKSKILTPRYF